MKRRTDNEEFVVTHPVNPSRKLFLSFDYTHILKNIRNQIIDRSLKWNGNCIKFYLIMLLFQKTIDDGLALCRFITRRLLIGQISNGWRLTMQEMFSGRSLLPHYEVCMIWRNQFLKMWKHYFRLLNLFGDCIITTMCATSHSTP